MCLVLRLDTNGSCESENIQVFDGNSTQGSLLGKVCSKNDYIPVFESSNTLTFQIVTDSERVQRTVFMFYYFFSPGTCKFSFTHLRLATGEHRRLYSPARGAVALSLRLVPPRHCL